MEKITADLIEVRRDCGSPEKADDFLSGGIQLPSGVLYLPQSCCFGPDSGAHVRMGIQIAAPHGCSPDLFRLQHGSEGFHGLGRIQIGIEAVNVDGGIVHIGIGMNADMGAGAESGENDFPFLIVKRCIAGHHIQLL